MRGIVQNIGFKRAVVYYAADTRISGKTHYMLLRNIICMFKEVII